MSGKGHRLVLLLWLCLAGAAPVLAQGSNDPNEGSRIEWDSTNSIYRFSWWGLAGRTYFIQHSDDLAAWTYVPIIEPGDDLAKEWGFTSDGDRFFLRLKFADTPTFDPFTDDFDGDGITNFDELQTGTDPLDYYDGQTPVLTIASGNNQSGLPNTLLSQPLLVAVTDANGVPLINAPVVFTITSKTGGKLTVSSGGQRLDQLATRTDFEGRARAFFQLPNADKAVCQISVSASGIEQSVGFSASSDGSVSSESYVSPFSPTDAIAVVNSDGSVDLSWVNHTDNETEIRIERVNDSGAWEVIGSVPPGSTSFRIPVPTP